MSQRLLNGGGSRPATHVADPEEYVRLLLQKLIEEATELKHATSPDHQKEEIADVREVLEALLVALNLSEDEILAIQASKAKERGGFAGRIILDEQP